jgi:hypothetical protein
MDNGVMVMQLDADVLQASPPLTHIHIHTKTITSIIAHIPLPYKVGTF